MSDLISRQAAIDALKKQMSDWNDDYNVPVRKSIENIERLPSAQPELDEWCTDCKEYDHEKHCCPRWNRVIRQTLKDMKEEQPERKKGKWIDRDGGIATCSICGDRWGVCGASMMEGNG